MQLEIDAQLDLSDLNAILEQRGLTPGGRVQKVVDAAVLRYCCLLYTSPSPRDGLLSRMPSSA